MTGNRICSHEDCPPANSKRDRTVKCGKCDAIVHLLCIGIEKTVAEVFFHKNIRIFCNSCTGEPQSTPKTTPKQSTPKQSTPKTNNSNSSILKPSALVKVNQRQPHITEYALNASHSETKMDEILSILNEAKVREIFPMLNELNNKINDVSTNVTSQGEKSKSYASVLAEIKENTVATNKTPNMRLGLTSGSIQNNRAPRLNVEFPVLSTRTPKRRRIDNSAETETPKSRVSAFKNRKLISGTGVANDCRLGSPVNLGASRVSRAKRLSLITSQKRFRI